MRRLACSTCKGTKSIREGGLLGMKLVKDLFETLDHTESQPLASALDLLNIEMIVGNWQLLQVVVAAETSDALGEFAQVNVPPQHC
ncbi:hypothetical protein DEO72_LG3g3006 [Vigna unguiculata]|uniref:Uncharacterized protein n=1 Tax=Vigna unguiculata TaxID=3917 RepID=A0A4D6LIW9_VIGUN|nr:hypothetical protein DEO72_LG3g3006 [Vigna unguiculata]